MVFNFLNRILCHADMQKLGELSELEKLKKKDECFEVLSHYVVDDPRALVRAFCSLYRVWDCKSTMLAFSKYIPQIHSPSALEYALVSMGSDFVLFLLRRIFEILKKAYANRPEAMTSNVNQEIVHIMTILGHSTSDGMASETCTRTLLGPQTKAIYTILVDIFSWAQTRLGWDPLGFLHTAMLPSLYPIMDGVRQRFGCSLNLRGAPSSAAQAYKPADGPVLDM